MYVFSITINIDSLCPKHLTINNDIEIVYLIDISSKNYINKYSKLKEWIMTSIKVWYYIANKHNDNISFGLIVYSYNNDVIFNLNSEYTLDEYLNLISEMNPMNYPINNGTYVNNALNSVNEMFETYGVNGRYKKLYMITDSIPKDRVSCDIINNFNNIDIETYFILVNIGSFEGYDCFRHKNGIIKHVNHYKELTDILPLTIGRSCHMITPLPTKTPTNDPSTTPTIIPSDIPTNTPSNIPTDIPSEHPSNYPTNIRTISPSITPTLSPINTILTVSPSFTPTNLPSKLPTNSPSKIPSKTPHISTRFPTAFPTATPQTVTPSVSPTKIPTFRAEIISQRVVDFTLREKILFLMIIIGIFICLGCILFICFMNKKSSIISGINISQQTISESNNNGSAYFGNSIIIKSELKKDVNLGEPDIELSSMLSSSSNSSKLYDNKQRNTNDMYCDTPKLDSDHSDTNLLIYRHDDNNNNNNQTNGNDSEILNQKFIQRLLHVKSNDDNNINNIDTPNDSNNDNNNENNDDIISDNKSDSILAPEYVGQMAIVDYDSSDSGYVNE